MLGLAPAGWTALGLFSCIGWLIYGTTGAVIGAALVFFLATLDNMRL